MRQPLGNGRFDYLCIFAQRIECEVFGKLDELLQLAEFDFQTMPEGCLERASAELKRVAGRLDGLAEEIENRRKAKTLQAAE